MPTESIVAALLKAAVFLKTPIADLASQSIKDAYEALKGRLRTRFAGNPSAGNALDLATDKPESLARKELLVEESAVCDLPRDGELHVLAEKLVRLLPAVMETGAQNVEVTGHGNCVQVAAGNLINTTKYVHRNAITPDERHLNTNERDTLRVAIAEVAERLAAEGGDPNFAAVHRMLQRRFGVSSYLLIPRERYDDALGFLKQQRAIFRSRLRCRNPAAYRNDFFRAIFSEAGELGWDRDRVHQFAAEKLVLKNPLTSLKQLGPIQLKFLAGAVQREGAKVKSLGIAEGPSGGASEK